MTERHPKTLTPWEAVTDFVADLIDQGHTYQTMRSLHPSSWTARYSATIGGTIFNHTEQGLRFLPLAPDQVGVWKVEDRECWEVFPLIDVYRAVWQEQHPDADPGPLMRTKPLFE